MQTNLIIWRKENGVTQQQMAQLLGITQKQYSLKERGKAQFTLDEMFEIAKFVGKSVDQIFLPRTHQNGAAKERKN
jgi:putative transcriptional regulator